jgi:uncharacterized membrane protein
MLAVGVVGFDAAVMARAFRLGRMVHDVATYTIGFGSVLVVWNLLLFGLFRYYAKRVDRPVESRLKSTPPPLVIFGLYAAVVGLAILSVLFFTSGRF